MKRISVTVFGKKLNKHLQHIPKEGFLVVKNKVPIAQVNKPNEGEIREEVKARAKEAIRTVKIDTFTEKRVGEIEETMGMCSRCGTQGKVVRKMYLNEYGNYSGKWLCLARCFNKDMGARDLVKVVPQETSTTVKDFGGSNVKNTF